LPDRPPSGGFFIAAWEKTFRSPPCLSSPLLISRMTSGAIYTWVVRTWFTKAVTASSIAKAILVALALSCLGNQFQSGPLNQFGSKSLVGYELVKFGGDLSGLVNQQNSATPPGQASGSLNVPQSLASQFIAPYIALGAVQRKGISEWVTGAGSEFVLAQNWNLENWNLDIRYLYAPAQSGLDAMNLVTIGANYHFSAK
jgi:hypothetical protein